MEYSITVFLYLGTRLTEVTLFFTDDHQDVLLSELLFELSPGAHLRLFRWYGGHVGKTHHSWFLVQTTGRQALRTEARSEN